VLANCEQNVVTDGYHHCVEHSERPLERPLYARLSCMMNELGLLVEQSRESCLLSAVRKSWSCPHAGLSKVCNRLNTPEVNASTYKKRSMDVSKGGCLQGLVIVRIMSFWHLWPDSTHESGQRTIQQGPMVYNVPPQREPLSLRRETTSK